MNAIIQLRKVKLIKNKAQLNELPIGKVLINTINAFSYNNALKDKDFAMALLNGDALIPDGMSVVKACQWLKNPAAPTERVAGWDLFEYEMEALNASGTHSSSVAENAKPNSEGNKPKVMFFGSSEKVLALIKEKCAAQYPNLQVVTYSPTYKAEFSEKDNQEMIHAINDAQPDLLWIGMTAPKQEKWTYANWDRLNINCHVGTVGAVFDFYAGTTKRAPQWWQQHGLEWFYRLVKEPRRMWKRYIIGNVEFLLYILIEKFGQFRKK